MNVRRLSVILIAVAFVLIALFSCVGLTAVKKIDVKFAVSAEQDAETIQGVLDQYIGKNILFIGEEDVRNSLKGYHKLEVLSVDKRFPNILTVEIKERREVYDIEYNGKVYVATENGFIINSYTGHAEESRERILLDLGELEITDVKLGSNIKTDNDTVLSKVFDIAKKVNLTDCIKSISISKESAGVGTVSGYEYDVNFKLHTGVEICVWDLMLDGENKGVKGFEIYDTEATDYQKRFGQIQVIYANIDGVPTLRVLHNYDGKDAVLFESAL